MNQYLTYIIAQGDTIETISQSQLKINLSRAIIALNDLRYPFISDDPIDQYAFQKGELQVLNTVNGAQVTLGNRHSLRVQELDTVFFRDFTSGLYESAIIKHVSVNMDNTVSLTLEKALSNSYAKSAIVSLFVNQQNIQTKVLKTGDTLYLPATIQNIASAKLSTSDVYGTDIYLDDDGFMTKVDGDLKTVSGVDNVAQAVILRWRTPYGQLPGDSTYGNRLFELLGEENAPYYHTLSLAFAKQCAVSDPRVENLEILDLTSELDSIKIRGDVKVVNSDKNKEILTSILTGGRD